MKKLLTIILSVILAFGTIALVGCGGTESATDNSYAGSKSSKAIKNLSVQSVSAPVFGAKILNNYSTRSGQTGISKRLSATVEPADALNKSVDYATFWLDGAEKAEEPVSDYVVVEQDSDGSVDATITCIQPFGDDTIVVQVITRDGGYTAECVATYTGLSCEMDISSSVLLSNTQDRGDHYELDTDNTYTFTDRKSVV